MRYKSSMIKFYYHANTLEAKYFFIRNVASIRYVFISVLNIRLYF